MRLIYALICKFTGHRRGRCTGETLDATKRVIARTFKCPRCASTWSRKRKAAA